MNVVPLSVEPRTESGTKAAKILRGQGRIPAVLYSKNGVTHFSTTHNEVKSLVFTPDLKLAEIELDGKKHKALVKKVDFHPVTDAIEHLDFLELVEGHTLKADIPIKLKGVSPGVKNGGRLVKNLRTVKVKTTPENLVDEIFIDISKLTLGTSIRVKSLEIPEGVTVMIDPGRPVASVEVPRVLIDDEIDEELEEGEEGQEETNQE